MPPKTLWLRFAPTWQRHASRPIVGLSSWSGCAYILSSRVSTKAKTAELNFEGAITRLEAIVEQMESGKLPLEDLIVRYEEGMKLVKICQERLANAEQKIEIIARNSAGKPEVKNFEPAAAATNDNEPSDETESRHDEVRLF